MTIAAARFREVAMGRDDPTVDFCLWPYAPVNPPAPGALQGVNLLYAAADLGGALPEYRNIAAALTGGLGPYRTVWGVKWDGRALGCEFYFYDYNRMERAVPFAKIARMLSPFVTVPETVDEEIPYFMASVEVPMQAGGFPGHAGSVDLYVGNPGSTVSSGICYRAGPSGRELKNFYFFFDRRKEWDEIVSKAACSAQVPLSHFDMETVLPPWLADCRVIVVANKRRCDAVYFSGISIDQLIRFLTQFGYPEALIAYAKETRPRLAHLQFDVGFDYRMDAGGIAILKSGFYNVY